MQKNKSGFSAFLKLFKITEKLRKHFKNSPKYKLIPKLILEIIYNPKVNLKYLQEYFNYFSTI